MLDGKHPEGQLRPAGAAAGGSAGGTGLRQLLLSVPSGLTSLPVCTFEGSSQLCFLSLQSLSAISWCTFCTVGEYHDCQDVRSGERRQGTECECLVSSALCALWPERAAEASSTSVLTFSASLAFLSLFPVHLCPQLSGRPDS